MVAFPSLFGEASRTSFNPGRRDAELDSIIQNFFSSIPGPSSTRLGPGGGLNQQRRNRIDAERAAALGFGGGGTGGRATPATGGSQDIRRVGADLAIQDLFRRRNQERLLGALDARFGFGEQRDPLEQLQEFLGSIGFGGPGAAGGGGGTTAETILGNFIQPLLDALGPSEDIARENLRSAIIREGGAGALESGAATESFRRLEENLGLNRGALAASGQLEAFNPIAQLFGNLAQNESSLNQTVIQQFLSALGGV